MSPCTINLETVGNYTFSNIHDISTLIYVDLCFNVVFFYRRYMREKSKWFTMSLPMRSISLYSLLVCTYYAVLYLHLINKEHSLIFHNCYNIILFKRHNFIFCKWLRCLMKLNASFRFIRCFSVALLTLVSREMWMTNVVGSNNFVRRVRTITNYYHNTLAV